MGGECGAAIMYKMFDIIGEHAGNKVRKTMKNIACKERYYKRPLEMAGRVVALMQRELH